MKKLTRQIYTPTNLNHSLLFRLQQNDQSLVRVIFSSRDLGPRGAHTLVEALRENTNLKALDLSSNSLGPEGAKSIAFLLQYQAMMASSNGEEHGGVNTLLLGDNNLRDDGVRSIACALEGSSIESLSIDDNRVGATGLAVLCDALGRNSKLKRLHLSHNSFQSLSPLIKCTFDKRSLDSVAESNHTLKHVFLNCGYHYECEELEFILRINRMGKVEARKRKLALYLEEDLGRLLQLDIDTKLLPRLLGILAQQGSISTVLNVMQNLPSDLLCFCGEANGVDDSMDIEYISW